MKSNQFCTKKSLSFTPFLLATTLLLPWSIHAANNNALLPDMHATTSGLQTAVPLTRLNMNEAVKRAVEWHPMVIGARERTNQQGEEVGFAKSAYLPQLSTGINTNYRDSVGRSEEAFTLSGTQLVYDFGKVSSNIEAAEYGVERNQADTLRIVDQLARETAFTVLEVLRYQELVKIAGEQVAGVTDLLELSKKRSALGASTRSDEMQAQSRREAALASELQMIAELQMWQRTLQNLVGSTVVPEVMPGTPAALEQACFVDISTLNNVPEIMVAEAQRSEAMANIKASQADFFPTVTAEAGAEHYFKERDRDLNTGDRRDRNDYTFGLNFNVNLYQGGATTSRKRGAEYALNAANAAKDEALLNVARSLQKAKTLAATYDHRLSLLQSRMQSIAETQEIYRKQYISLGTRSLLDLLNTEQEVHQARMEKHNTEQDLKRLQIDCLYNTASLRSTFALDSDESMGQY